MKESNSLNNQTSKLYLENREKINELVNIASETKNWLMRIFTDPQFIRNLNGFTVVHTDRANSPYRYVMYKLPETDELVITIYYELLWNSKPGDARLLFLIEPIGEWLKKAEALEENGEKITQIVKEEGIGYNYSHNKRFWHCGGIECKINESQILDEEYIKNCILDNLVNPNSKLMKAATRIAEEITSNHYPSYSWDDALMKLQELLSEIGGEDYARWETSGYNLISYDRTNKVVVIEVIDDKRRNRLEEHIFPQLMTALKYTYGEDVRCSIIWK